MKIVSVRILILLFVFPSALLAQNSSRKWTNSNGIVIDAELASYDGSVATLIKNGKEFPVKVETLSEEDRQWLTNWQKEKTKKFESLIGLLENIPISHRYGKTTDDYFAGPFGAKHRKFYDTKVSICDDGKKGLFMKCDESVAWKDQNMLVYCPPSYKGESTPMGIYINISAGDTPIALKQGYDKVMDQRKLIYASPYGTSNNQSDVRRMALVLDTLASLRANYQIDNSRVFVGGVSGGGAMSSWMAVYFPEFRGALNQVRNAYIPSESCFPSVDEGDVKGIVRRKQAFAWITGPKDFNYKHILLSAPTWNKKGFVSKLFDVPGMSHGSAPADALAQALDWAEASSMPPKGS